ncbi:uncharacterized protein LOC112544940 isoform X2 [Pelodiscus sinensis]|uniref:uncharacterized protein LOC112544940 isoform X2 n=1 Tax=Pelodiscus sinensis TaxID=13735 RepID=UPI003F6B6D78
MGAYKYGGVSLLSPPHSPEGKNRSRTVSQARKSRTREFCSSPTKSRMNFWVVKANGLMAALVGAVWNELMFCIQIYSQFQRTFLSLPWVLQDRVKRVFRSCVSRLCQGSWLPLLSVSAGITAIGVMVFFFCNRLVTLEGEAPEPLSVADLLRVQGQLEAQEKMTYELRACMDLALQEFMREPPSVQDNAQMLIQCQGTMLEFKSGDGENEIYVHYHNGEPQYDMKEPTMEVYLARMRSHPEQLSVENLLRVQTKLEAWGKMTNELRDCFIHAQEKFQQEPVYVQQNAKMLIHGSGRILEFLSGTGECEISVFYQNRELQYHVKELTVEVYLARLHYHPEQLSVENLLRVQAKLESGGKMTEILRRCFELTLEKFPKEPSCLQHNTRLVISAAGTELVFVSGWGENEINVYHDNWGVLQYVVIVPGWVTWIARNILIIGFMVLLVIILNIVPFRITRQPHSNLLALGNHSR